MAGYRGKYKGRRSNEPRPYSARSNERTPMLNLHRVTTFTYDLKEILSHYKISETVAPSFIASVTAKASRISIDSSIQYVREQEKAGAVPKEASDEICSLLERWSRLR